MSVKRKRLTCRVVGGYVRTVCSECRKKIVFSVRPDEKRRSVTCHKCGHKYECGLNRRCTMRETLIGLARLNIDSRRIFLINLRDFSCFGVGFTVPVGKGKDLRIGQELSGITCDWYPRLPRSKIIVQNISGDHIGVKFCR